MEKKIFVVDLQEGDRFDEVFLVKMAKMGETRAGKPYMTLTVMDKSGEISGPVWDNADQLHALCVPGQVTQISGVVQSYRDNLQLKINGIQQVTQTEVDLGDYLPASVKSRDEMAADLQKIINSISDPYIKKLLKYFFHKSDWWTKFQVAPAAKGIHHAYIGGLLEHSLSVAQIADFLSGHYEGVNRSLLIAGALLHDIGKLEELTVDAGIVDYTVRGRLLGHLVIGSEMVASVAARIKDFPEDILEQLQHLVLSHHGRKEFGSPTVPMTVEALVLSFLDDMDAKMNLAEQLRRKMETEEMGWTDYQRSLERFLYLGGFEKKEPLDDTVESDNSRRQPTLF